MVTNNKLGLSASAITGVTNPLRETEFSDLHDLTVDQLDALYRKVWDSRDPDEDQFSQHVSEWQQRLGEIEEVIAYKTGGAR